MTIADDIDDLLDEGREAAEELMRDECNIKRPIGKKTTDPAGKVTTTYRPLYSGQPCKVKVRDVDAVTPRAGERTVTLTRVEIDLPIDTIGVTVDDVIDITAAEDDEDLVGCSFRVVAPFHASLKTARRLPVEEVVG